MGNGTIGGGRISLVKPLNIKEEGAFTEALAELAKKYPRTEEWWVMGWSWRLVRDPLTGSFVVPNATPATYVIKTEGYEKFGAPPVCTLMYRFDDQYLHMLDIKNP